MKKPAIQIQESKLGVKNMNPKPVIQTKKSKARKPNKGIQTQESNPRNPNQGIKTQKFKPRNPNAGMQTLEGGRGKRFLAQERLPPVS